MDLTRALDGYCERLDPGYWAEPVNALSNVAFVLAAAICWRRVGDLVLARLLCAVLALIGIGSYLFHTHAQVWSAYADVLPIAGFILLFLYGVNRHVWSWPMGWALLGTFAFLPYAALSIPLFQRLPFFSISASYWPVTTLILIYAILLCRRAPATARGLAIGGGLLAVSLSFRSLDMAVCPVLPMGTHFVWHLLNGAMLGWMIEVYRRHMVAGSQTRG